MGCIVTDLAMEPGWVVRFYNQRGPAEQHIKEGKSTFCWMRLSLWHRGKYAIQLIEVKFFATLAPGLETICALHR